MATAIVVCRGHRVGIRRGTIDGQNGESQKDKKTRTHDARTYGNDRIFMRPYYSTRVTTTTATDVPENASFVKNSTPRFLSIRSTKTIPPIRREHTSRCRPMLRLPGHGRVDFVTILVPPPSLHTHTHRPKVITSYILHFPSPPPTRRRSAI